MHRVVRYLVEQSVMSFNRSKYLGLSEKGYCLRDIEHSPVSSHILFTFYYFPYLKCLIAMRLFAFNLADIIYLTPI